MIKITFPINIAQDTFDAEIFPCLPNKQWGIYKVSNARLNYLLEFLFYSIIMAATFATFVLLALLKVSTCSPVKPSTVEERIQRLEDAAELQYEFTNNIDERLSVLETFVAELLHGNSTDAHFNGTLSKTDLGNLQQKLSQQLFSRANDSMSMLTGNAAMRK